ncbi:hypothetical protein [Dehalobacter sp. TeCB1]|uniref:hypothetical protein n=1 Tax=Dehalobacter sp. TeCB1 TaxID=1843715 RepID=UPI00083A5CF9|nr:hypothetical protein [Dehalobacter sp. TeCB1]OCZ51371.1 hypothetical protein A7D23_13195 [Dehalobacter sp. TeCB1]
MKGLEKKTSREELFAAAWAERTAKFIAVRDALRQTEHSRAYRMAFKQPWKFYNDHTIDEAIKILVEQYAE